MRRRLTDYIFDASAKTITIIGEDELSLDDFSLIRNVTSNDNIFIAGGGASYKMTLVGNVLTLTFDTTTMADDDVIQIYYDDGLPASSSDENNNLNYLLWKVLDEINNPMHLNMALNALRVEVANASLAVTLTSTNVGTVTNQTNIGGQDASSVVTNLRNVDYDTAITNRFNFTA